MHTVTVPAEGSPMRRSVAASLASILEIDTSDVPLPGDAHDEPWTVWSHWLAQRGLGFIPVADPIDFNWPGPWLALLPSGDGDLVGAVAFGSPPGIAWQPLPGPAGFSAVQAGYVIAPADVALWRPVKAIAPRRAGRVEAIAIASEAEMPMISVDTVVARAGQGLEGDRYFEGRGTFSNPNGVGYDVTLIEAEVLDDLRLPSGPLAPEDARRNLVTRGIDLNALVGERFTIGDVLCIGQRLCEPCAHLERLTARHGTLRALVHKGGLRADILSDGEISIGAPIVCAEAGASV